MADHPQESVYIKAADDPPQADAQRAGLKKWYANHFGEEP